eukprot:4186026-Lingulodinium_polyedra.AAC.1
MAQEVVEHVNKCSKPSPALLKKEIQELEVLCEVAKPTPHLNIGGLISVADEGPLVVHYWSDGTPVATK